VLEARTGPLELRLPAELELPDRGGVRVELLPRGSRPSLIVGSQWFREPPFAVDAMGKWDGPRIALGRAGAGDWTVRVEAFRLKPTSATSWSHEQLIQRVEIPITILPGETTIVEVP